ncbi:MAG: two-component regulator propeller domain-containing protein [Bacteroidota bacterium]
MHPFNWNILAFLFSFTLSVNALAQPYAFKAYSLTEGLPQSQVWCSLNDQMGYLWFGTQGGGLSRFDGKAFTTFTTADGLPSNFILSLYEAPDGILWIGTNQGLCRFDGQQFTTIRGLPFPVRCNLQVDTSTLLIGSELGLFSMHPKAAHATSKHTPPLLSGATIYAFAKTPTGIWAGTNEGLWHFGDSLTQKVAQHNVTDLLVKDNQLYLTLYGKGLYQYTDQLEELHRGYPLIRPMCLLQDTQGQLFIGTQDQGLVQYQAEEIPKAVVLPNQNNAQKNIRDLTLDQANRIWISSSGGGIACRTRQNFTHWDRSSGLDGDRVYALQADTSQRLWLSISRKGLQMLENGIPKAVEPPYPFPNLKTKTLCRDTQGQLWAGTEGRGVAVLDSAGWYNLTSLNGLPSNWINQLISHPDGSIWGASYDNGLFKITPLGFRNYQVDRYNEEQGLPSNSIHSIALDSMQQLWFGTYDGKIGRLATEEAFPIFGVDQGIPRVPIRSLAFDAFGRMWMGTKGRGILFGSVQDSVVQFTPLSEVQTSTATNIYFIYASIDAEGQNSLWAGSERGVEHIQLDSLGQIIAVTAYDRNDGFVGIETCHNSVTQLPDGTLWFGTMNGLTRYAPGQAEQQCITPTIHFTGVDLFYKPLQETEWADFSDFRQGIKPGLVLPFRQNHLSFRFQAVSQIHPEEVQYRWKLEGAETEWAPPAPTQVVNYAQLSPGTYRFVVQAAIEDCPWGAPIATSFEIEAPFWQKAWFLPSLVALAVLLIGWIAWLSVRSIKKREQSRREDLELQNKLLQLEQKALQLQMNPHFIFNALTGIQSLIALGEHPKARRKINDFAVLMRSTLNNARKSTISLAEEIEALRQYLEVEQFCQPKSFDFTITVDPEIEAEAIELPPMLLQPFIENAVIHGVSHLPYPGKIELNFATKEDLLEVTIKDNGIGRERAALLKAERKPGHQSVALKVNKERLEALRNGYNYIALSISDVLDTDGKIQGTLVCVRLPIVHSY